MAPQIRRIRSCAAMILALVGAAFAQNHFTFTSNTGNNMTVLVKAAIKPTIEGSALSNGDEVGVFSPSLLCAGAGVWNGQNLAITVWGDNDQTPAVDGMSAGEILTFKIWEKSASKEVLASVTYESGGPKYSADGIAILASLASQSTSIAAPKTNQSKGDLCMQGNSIKFQLKHETKVAIDIFTIDGKKLFERKAFCRAGEHGFDLSGLPVSPGKYFCRFEWGNAKTIRTIFVLH